MTAPSDEIDVHFTVVADIELDNVDDIIKRAGELGGTLKKQESLGLSPALEAVLTIGLSAHLAIYYLDFLRRSFRSGMLIDASGPELVVKRDRSIPRGMTVIVSDTGELDVKEGEKLPFDVIESIVRGVSQR